MLCCVSKALTISEVPIAVRPILEEQKTYLTHIFIMKNDEHHLATVHPSSTRHN